MSTSLSDTYGPWPSDSEPALDYDSETVTAEGDFHLPEQTPSPTLAGISSWPSDGRSFTVTIVNGGVTVRLITEAASLAEALEKAAAAIRR